MKVPFDEIDAKLVAERQAKRDKRKGARAGDFLKMSDGSLRRFSSNPTKIVSGYGSTRREQHCCILAHHFPRTNSDGTYFLLEDGGVEFGGGNDFVEGLVIRDTGQIINGEFWAWHHDVPMGEAGAVDFTIPCRLFEVSHE